MPTGYILPIGTQFFDDSGNPLNGGKLNGYITGTSTRQDFFTSSTLGVAHANPAILDAAGRITAYIQDGVAYKFVLTNSLDVVIRTWDPITVPQIAAAAAASNVPVGGIIPYGGTSAPSGYLLCDGTAVSRSTFAALFAIMGTAFGVGNGSTTFNLPDMRQRFPIGKATSGTGAVLGETGGTIDHTHTGPAHTHDTGTFAIPSAGAHTHVTGNVNEAAADLQLGAGEACAPAVHTHNIASSGAHVHTITGATGSSGTGATGTANPPYQACNYIVKT